MKLRILTKMIFTPKQNLTGWKDKKSSSVSIDNSMSSSPNTTTLKAIDQIGKSVFELFYMKFLEDSGSVHSSQIRAPSVQPFTAEDLLRE